MKDGKPSNTEPERRRQASAGRRGGGPKKQRGYIERATASGHSGHGSESVRPHLRDQLRLKSLLPHPFPTSDAESGGKDEALR